jgi:aminotransferase class V
MNCTLSLLDGCFPAVSGWIKSVGMAEDRSPYRADRLPRRCASSLKRASARRTVDRGRRAQLRNDRNRSSSDGLRLLRDFIAQGLARAARHRLPVREAGTDRLALALVRRAKAKGEDIRKFEAIGTHPMYQIAAVNQALDFHEAIGVARIRARLHYLKRNWADHLARLPNISFHTALEPDQSCAIANVEITGIDPSQLHQHLLDRHRIRAWPIKRADFQGLWVAPFIYTQPRELDRFVSVMTKIARQGLPA